MSKQVYTVTKEGIEYVCSLINQIVTLPSDVIDDLNIATNTTYSSYKLNVDLNNLETNINDRTDKLIASLNKLSKKIITAESEIVDENTLYLLLIDSTNNVYQQWLLIDGSPVMVGTTEMSLDSVYTKDEADVKFGLKTVSDTLVTEVTGIKETIGTEDLTTIATTLKGAINELEAKHYLEVYDLQNTSVLDYAKTFDALTHNYFYANNCIDLPDNMNYGYCAVDVSQDPLYRDITFYCPTTGRIYVNTIGADPDDATVFGTWSGWHRHLNDDDIVTTLDDTVTDNQIPSAKEVYDTCIKDANIKTYTSVTQLGLTSGCSVGDIFNALPSNSIFRARATTTSGHVNEVTDIPFTQGILLIDKYDTTSFSIQFKRSANGSVSGNDFWIGQLKGIDGTGLTWRKVCTTSVEDVEGSGTQLEQTGYTVTNLKYTIVNGICYIPQIQITCNTPFAVSYAIGTGLPIPNIPTSTSRIYTTLNCWGDTSGSVASLGCGVDKSGKLVVAGGTAGKSYVGGISYTVAES